MANEVLKNLGDEIVLETSGAAVTDGSFVELTDDDRQPGDNTGYVNAIFEFSTAAGGFSAAPTAGARINLYEQKINSDSNDAPDVDGNYEYDLIGWWEVNPTDEQQHLSIEAPIHRYGGKYWIEWLDGGSGTAQISAGWVVRLIPWAWGNA